MKPIWTTQCVLQNFVDLYSPDWNHVTEGHPEMIGQEAAVKRTIENPSYVQEAGNPKTAAYVSAPDIRNAEGIRVIVRFPSEMWTAGNQTGFVATSYPINTAQYSKPDLGSVIWSAPEESK